MAPSLENRQRIALLVFFVGDHLLWYYGGHFQQVSLFYVVVSEIVRVGTLAAVLLSLLNINFVKEALMAVMVYCFVMFPFNLNAASSYSVVLKKTSLNLLWFKKDSTVAVDQAFWASLLYIWFLMLLYFIVFKHMDKHLLAQQGSR